MTTEPIAWYVLTGLLTIVIIVLGFFLRDSYNKLMARLRELDDTIKKFQSFLDKQEIKNEKYEETKKRVDVLEDRVIEIQKVHETCPNYPYNAKGQR